MSSDAIARVQALATKAEELTEKGLALRAAENYGRAAEAATALGQDNLVTIHMQQHQGGVLGSFAMVAMEGERRDSQRNFAALRAECVALLSSAAQALERRRVAGTLLDGTCSALEVDWQLRQIKRYNGTRLTNAEAASWAALMGYEEFISVASNICGLLAFADKFAGECSCTQFESFAQHVVLAAALMQQPRRRVDVSMPFEAVFPARLQVAVISSTTGANGLDERLVQMLATAWQRLQHSGVLQARGCNDGITRVMRGTHANQAAAEKSMSAHGLRSCALAGCGARELHVAHFKSCAACKAAAYCCK